MEEYADLQEQLITARIDFEDARIFALQVFAKVSLSCWRMLKEERNRRQGAGIDIASATGITTPSSLKNVKKHGRKGVCRTKSG